MQNQEKVDQFELRFVGLMMCQMHPESGTERTEESGEQQRVLRRPPLPLDGFPLIAEEHQHRNDVQYGIDRYGDVEVFHGITAI